MSQSTKTAVPMGTAPQQQSGQTNGLATASLVCGVVGLIVFGIILGPIAICLGVSAKTKIHENPGMQGEGSANAGIVMGIIDVIGWAIVIFFFYGSS